MNVLHLDFPTAQILHHFIIHISMKIALSTDFKILFPFTLSQGQGYTISQQYPNLVLFLCSTGSHTNVPFFRGHEPSCHPFGGVFESGEERVLIEHVGKID